MMKGCHQTWGKMANVAMMIVTKGGDRVYIVLRAYYMDSNECQVAVPSLIRDFASQRILAK